MYFWPLPFNNIRLCKKNAKPDSRGEHTKTKGSLCHAASLCSSYTLFSDGPSAEKVNSEDFVTSKNLVDSWHRLLLWYKVHISSTRIKSLNSSRHLVDAKIVPIEKSDLFMMNFDTAGQDKPDTSTGLAAPRFHIFWTLNHNFNAPFQARIYVRLEDWKTIWNPRERPVWSLSLCHRIREAEQSEDAHIKNISMTLWWPFVGLFIGWVMFSARLVRARMVLCTEPETPNLERWLPSRRWGWREKRMECRCLDSGKYPSFLGQFMDRDGMWSLQRNYYSKPII